MSSYFYDYMYTNKVPMTFGKEIGHQHHRSSTILNSGNNILFSIFVFCFTQDPHEVIVAEKARFSTLFQYSLVSFTWFRAKDREGLFFFLASLLNNQLAKR
ncbi:hypothetical protein ILYODFUR_003590 [Ilyodon furcidens]|uniref:Uncharacterized protein n=1 Tax=Ilyodon furcidens TaxID=33524 RepID=A0ABV0TH42_9TELE